jgi:NAD(P)-dependent dehydrogenase (short-subunit alcohol dehydrogenase family)
MLLSRREKDMSDPDKGRLAGQYALVSGASSGIGLAVARGLAEAGAAVVVNHTANQEPAEALVADIRAADGRTIAVEANVAWEADVARLFNKALAAFGRLDLLVANAGIQRDAKVAEMTLADWQAVMDVNLTGQFLCCSEAIQVFRQQKSQERTTRALGRATVMQHSRQFRAKRIYVIAEALIEHVAHHHHAILGPLSHAAQFGMAELRHGAAPGCQRLQEHQSGITTDAVLTGNLVQLLSSGR